MVLASNPIVVCGTGAIGWSDLQNVFEELQHTSMPSMAAWDHLFSIWLSITRPVVWNGQEIRKLPSVPSRMLNEWSVNAYRKVVFTRRRLELFKQVVRISLPLLAWAALVALVISMFYRSSSNFIFIFPAVIFFLGFCGCTLLLLYLVIMGVLALRTEYEAEQQGERREQSNVLIGIIHALQERQASVAKDKSFAMYGVLSSLGITVSQPDYKDQLGLVYQKLLTDLVTWRPAMISLLIDIGTTLPNTPSWVPDWSTIHGRRWLQPQYLFDNFEDIDRFNKSTSDLQVTISGNELAVPARTIGCLTFAHGSFARVNVEELEDDNSPSVSALQTTLYILSHWISLIRNEAPVSPSYDSVPSAVYDVLCGREADNSTRSASAFNKCFRMISKHHAAFNSVRMVESSALRAQATQEMMQKLRGEPNTLQEYVKLVNGWRVCEESSSRQMGISALVPQGQLGGMKYSFSEASQCR